MFQKELLTVASFQTVLCHNFNVDIKTHLVASALNRISDTIIWLQTIDWYDSEARLYLSPIFETPLKMRVIDTKQENTLFLTRIESRFCIVGSPSHEFIIIAFYDERAEMVALI